MSRRPVDLRSDTVTQPTPAMRQVMAAAPVGDDRYGEDPSVNALQEHVADLFGHEAALFTPTGTMANQIALQLLVPPGRELLCDTDAHVLRYQSGALAALGGITTRTFCARRGRVDVDAVAAMLAPCPYAVPVEAVAVEQTHMRGGGTIQPLDTLRRLRALTTSARVGLHCDGARIWHAHHADDVPLSVYGGLFDTLAVCLSKGLGAPAGSLIISSRERIAAARRLRLCVGGQMRQAGILAAAGLHALNHHLPALADDHTRARRLATTLHPYRVVHPCTVRTNIVNLDVGALGLTGREVAAAARRQQVLLVAVAPGTVRAVTHRDLDDEAIEHAASVLAGILDRAQNTAPHPRPGPPLGPARPIRPAS